MVLLIMTSTHQRKVDSGSFWLLSYITNVPVVMSVSIPHIVHMHDSPSFRLNYVNTKLVLKQNNKHGITRCCHCTIIELVYGCDALLSVLFCCVCMLPYGEII